MYCVFVVGYIQQEKFKTIYGIFMLFLFKFPYFDIFDDLIFKIKKKNAGKKNAMKMECTSDQCIHLKISTHVFV